MVSPSKTKFSRVAANQQQKTASSNKVKLVKGPRPLIHHRFYLDIQKYQLANKIEYTIKELGGKIEFFLNKEITHFITDKDNQQNHPQHQHYPGDFDGGPSRGGYHLLSPSTPTTPLTPKTPLSHPYHHQHHHHHPHHLQYVNEAPPSSPCVSTTPASASGLGAATAPGTPGLATTGSECKGKPAQPRSRADAMLQRVRQQNQNNNPSASHHLHLSTSARSSRPASPCSPAPSAIVTSAAAATNTFRLDRNSQSPAQLAKSWGKPIWSTEYAIKFLKKVIETCKADSADLCAISKASSAANRKAANLQHLRGDFVKIESYHRHQRPAFQLFKKWPVLNLNAKASGSPFDSEKEKSVPAPVESIPVASNKTVKEAPESVKTTTATTNQTTNATAKQQTQQQQQQCGYCEICRIEYDVLANHLIAEEHSAFVNNDSNFVALDKLIGEGGVSFGTFLSENQKLVEDEVELIDKEENARSEICEKDNFIEQEREREEEPVEILVEEPTKEETPKVVRTYSRKAKGKNSPHAAPDPESKRSPSRSPPAKRTYAGRKPAPQAAAASIKPAATPTEAEAQVEALAAPSPPSTSAAEAQMFGRRSAIYHHPHNTLNHHNHQKAKAAKLVQQQQQAILNQASSRASELAAAAAAKESIPPPVEAADAMKVLNDSSTTNEKEKDRHSKRSVADRMGLKGSSIKQVHHPEEMVECEGLDPKNTKRISLGLRQNPKRANLNEDFTSLLDETLGPMRKQRIRRESAKRVNYSEPREDEIASQEEIMQSILESTAKEASESGKKKVGSPKGPLDVKIRGIRWRAPSPQSRPPVKSPMLYKVIEEPKPKNKKTTSPTKDCHPSGSPTKSSKNGLIVKIRRVRQSELSLLNDEAENFMFPKKDDSTDDETDEDRQTTSEACPGDYSQDIPSSDYDHHRNSSMRKSAGTPCPGGRKRTATPCPGRQPADSPSKIAAKDSDQESASTPVVRPRRANRGPAALLHDNAEYYKFPDPGSRLRFPEAPIQPDPPVEDDAVVSEQKKRGRKSRAQTPAPATMTSGAISCAEKQQQDILLATRSSPGSPYQHQEQLSNCGKTIINYVKGKEDGMGVFRWSNFNRNCKQIEPYRFAFERVPSLEPWYETFQRQDESCEKLYEYFGNTAYRKLPYEMGPLPSLQQNCCILNYRMKSKTPEATVPTSCSNSNVDRSSHSSCSSSTSSTGSNTAAGNVASTTTTSATGTTTTAACATKEEYDDKQCLSLPLKKRKLLVDSDRPRKSPREHASTLAILSLLHTHQQHNRRRTISGSSSVPIVTANLPPPSPIYSSPKKTNMEQQQEADSALGDEIRSSCGSDPITEKDASCGELGGSATKKIKFDPPVMEESFVNYKVMCQELDSFLSVHGGNDGEDDFLLGLEPPPGVKTVPIGAVTAKAPIKRNLLDIVQACDKEPPLSLKLISRHESIVRKIVQYDRKPRTLSAIPIKSFDGGGNLGFFKKRINRTGWPNTKKRIVTRKQQQLLTVKKEDAGEHVKKDGDEAVVEAEGSRKSSTEESQVSGATGDDKLKLEDEDDEEDDDEDEFEDTMTMLDDEEPNGKMDQLLTEDEEEPETPKMAVVDRPRTPMPIKTDEVLIPPRASSRLLPSSKYVTKTTTTMTRVDYNVPTMFLGAARRNTPTPPIPCEVQQQQVPNHTLHPSAGRSKSVGPSTTCPMTSAGPVVIASSQHEDDDKECDSISSRSIFVSDDCDTTSSTLINMCTTDDPIVMPGSQRNSATPQPAALPLDEPPDRPGSRSRLNSTRHLNIVPRKQRAASEKPVTSLQPVVCIEKLNCSSMRTRSSSRTPVKTYKRSVFTSALVNSAGKPLKRKRKKKHKLNGNSSASAGTSSPATIASSSSCSDELNSASSSLECDDSSQREDTPPRRSTKGRPPTPSPIKFSPRKLRKPRGRWYRER